MEPSAPAAASPPDPPVFVISLRRRPDRRRHMERLLHGLGLRATFIDAIDGAALTAEQHAAYDRRKALTVYGAEMTSAEIACHLSHLSVYRRIVAEGLEVALVLEDDVDCDPDLPDLLRAVLREAPRDWRVLRLQSTKPGVVRGDRPKTRGLEVARPGGRSLARLRTGVLGACGYLITRDGAERMLRYVARPFMPIDQAMDRYWENGIIPYVLRPFPIRQCEAIDSAIGPRKGQATPGRWPTLRRRARRAWDGLAKRWFHLTRMGGVFSASSP